MSELAGSRSIERDEAELIRSQYTDHVGVNFKLRKVFYEHATEQVDFPERTYEALGALGLSESGVLMEVGCSDGNDLITYRERSGHSGVLLGVDIDPSSLMLASSRAHAKGFDNIHAINAGVDELPLSDGSVDAVVAQFMLYHAFDVEIALSEIRRVLRPGGLFAVSTSGWDNKIMHRVLEQRIATLVNLRKPPVFASKFSVNGDNRAADILEKHFEIVDDSVVQNCDAYFAEVGEDWEFTDYEMSLSTMINSYISSEGSEYVSIPPRKFVEMLDRVVRPYMQNDIDQNGYFADHVHRQLFICRKPG